MSGGASSPVLSERASSCARAAAAASAATASARTAPARRLRGRAVTVSSGGRRRVGGLLRSRRVGRRSARPVDLALDADAVLAVVLELVDADALLAVAHDEDEGHDRREHHRAEDDDL